jgi:hypothetical protein
MSICAFGIALGLNNRRRDVEIATEAPVNQRRPIAIAIMVAVAAAGLSVGDAWAADANEVQEMRREVAQMRNHVQALLSAVTEATELERQRSAMLTKAIKELGAPVPAAPPPSAPAPSSESAGESRPASTPSIRPASDVKPKSTAKRRHRRSGRAKR